MLNRILNVNTDGLDAATIDGAMFTQTGGSINVDAGESLRFSSEFHTLISISVHPRAFAVLVSLPMDGGPEC